MVAKARETILKTIEARLRISLGPHIAGETVNTPPSWKSAFNLDRGAILGLSHSFFNVLSFRPKTRHPDIHGLYFVGASTHPGTGVPIVMAGAKIVSEQILEETSQRIVPWIKNGAATEAKTDNPLDQVQWSPLLSWLHWVFVVIFAVILSIFGVALSGWDWKLAQFSGDW